MTTFSQIKPYNTPCQVRHISSTDGLSQVTVRSIIKDRNGYIWIGTIDGLNRFDGKNIVRYFHNPKDGNTVCGNFINTLFEDKKGRIWIGTTNQGFCFYNPGKARFERPETDISLSGIINESVVINIFQDATECIWIGTKKSGLIRLYEDRNGHFRATLIPVGISKQIITASFISKDNEIWVGTENGRVFRSQKITGPMQIPKFQPIENFNIKNRINTFIDDTHFVWIGSNDGLWNIDKKSGEISYYDLNTAGKLKTRKYFVFSMAFSSSGDLWVGAGNGLYHLQRRNDDFWFTQTDLFQENSPVAISHNTVYSLLNDSQFLWIGTARNLDVFDFKKTKFHNIKNGLSNSIVLSVYKNKGELWVGTASGLNLIKGNKTYHFMEDPANPNSIADNIVKSITPDHKGYLWLGTTKGISVIKLNEFDPENPVFTCIYSDPDNPHTLSDDNTTCVFADRNNQIWITTNSQGINRFTGDIDHHNFSFQRYKSIPNNPNSISSNNTYHIAQDTKGDYWLATENGLDKMTVLSADYSKIRIKNYKHNSKNPSSISSNSVKNIFFDKDGIMWVGTRFGLNKYNAENDSFRSFYTSDGLSNEWICFIQEDELQNIWIGTIKGLDCLNKTNDSITNYFVRDGIANNEFNTLACFKDRKGNIYTGNLSGLTFFNPADVLQKQEPKKVIITEILKPRTNVKSKKINREMLRVNYTTGNPIELNYNDFPLYIKFASPLSGPFEEPDYYYKLEPADEEWNYLGEREEIQLLNPSPGDYTLLLTGGKNGRIWTENASKLQLSILPPWWKSGWAYLLYSLLFLSIVFGFYRFSLAKKLEHQENIKLTELAELKTKLYGNITHELRTPLTVIMGAVESIKRELSDAERTGFESKLKVLSGNSKKLLFLINQMLDLNKIESGKMQLSYIQADIIPFLKMNLETYHSLSQHKNIDLIYYDEDEKIVMDFDPEKMSMIMSNIVSNAIKFTPENGKVFLHVKKTVHQNKPFLYIKIKDNGIGISEEDQKHIFDRFYQVERFTHTGTGIGLSLTKELVELMQGSIEVKSKLHQGTEFIITIPITNKAKTAKSIPGISVPPIEEYEPKKSEEPKIQNEELPILLIIEDNYDVAQFIASGLTHQYQIIFSTNGKEGIEKALEVIPDMIITDLMMPEKDGFEVCDVLKNDDRTSHIPIIMLTARTLQEDKIKGLAYGADAYLTKPFNRNELLIRVEQLILNRKRIQKKYEKTGFLILEEDSKETAFINKCIQKIQEHLDDENFKSAQLAFAVHLSESQLYRKIKAVTNLSTAIFIRETRLTIAKDMLQKTGMNISEIAYQCGFSNPDWFSKTFKEKYGYSPSDFRKNL